MSPLWQPLLSMIAAIIAALFGVLLALIPGLHVWGVLACTVLILHPSGPVDSIPMPSRLAFVAGLVAAMACADAIPSLVFGTTDESTLLTARPARRLRDLDGVRRAAGRSAEGSLVGALVAIIACGVLLGYPATEIQIMIQPHRCWMATVLSILVLLSQGPRMLPGVRPPLRQLAEAWKPLLQGWAVFAATGLAGAIALNGQDPGHLDSWRTLTPLLAGILSIPTLLATIARPRSTSEKESDRKRSTTTTPPLLAGVVAGSGCALFTSQITGLGCGMATFLTERFTSRESDRSFLFSQALTRQCFFLCSFALITAPPAITAHKTPQQGTGVHSGTVLYLTMLAALTVGSWVAARMVPLVTRRLHKTVERYGSRPAALVALAALILALFLTGGWRAPVIALASIPLGLLPRAFGITRLYCLGAILVPLSLQY